MAYITYEELCAEIPKEADWPEEALFDEKAVDIQEYIELLTGQFFEAREKTLVVNGTGNGIIVMPVPIISVTKVEFRSGSTWTEYALANFSIFNRYWPDDRKYPKIEYELGVFPDGSQNIRVTGTFGFTEEGGTTPRMIKKVFLMLLICFLPEIEAVKGNLRKAKTWFEKRDKGSEFRVAEAMSQGTLTGDPEIDNILRLYTRPGSVSSL